MPAKHFVPPPPPDAYHVRRAVIAEPSPWARLPVVLRRLIIWTTICSISAAPSFALGLSFGSAAGMIAGVALFIALYTAATCTARFERLYRRPFIRSTMYIGYGLRLVVSASTLLVALGIPIFFIVPDMWSGMASVSLANALGLPIGIDSRATVRSSDAEMFVAVFVTTCIQGALLNVLVFIVMAIAYAIQRATRKVPSDDDPVRGFQVVMNER